MAEQARIEWHGDEYKEKVHEMMLGRLMKASEEVNSQTTRNLKAISTRSEGPSKPGEIPHADTGRLSNSIFWDVTDEKSLTAIVGTPLMYGLWLEYGTSKMEARPFLRRTLADMNERVKTIMTKNLPKI